MLGTLLFLTAAFSQERPAPGILAGNVMDENKKALVGATVQLIPLADSLGKRSLSTDNTGSFEFASIPFGYYRLSITYVGLQGLSLDSIHFRAERFDFNLSDLTLKARLTDSLEAIVIYAEKPLIQSKDGNITFNAGESALAAGINASELLTQVPLVAKDADGKITVRGKEPRILIDDKPVELNLQQLQDLLESMPGSSIEKIEVMTNPPPQYANEQGGVINITTKKGKVGISGRASVSMGSRGDVTVNAGFTYRKQGLAININTGGGYNKFQGNGYSMRNNLYMDSSNYFNTTNNYTNKALRPNLRVNIDYDINKNNLLSLTLHLNQNKFENTNSTEYRNINRYDELWKLSRRDVSTEGSNRNPSLSLGYTWKGRPGETLKIITNYNFSDNESNRVFYQQFFNPDYTPNGLDSLQQQLNETRIDGHNIRVSYDRMLKNKKTFISLGSAYNRSNNHVVVEASYKKKPEGQLVPLEILSNNFKFHQTIYNYRASVKQVLGENFSFTAGTALEQTAIWFELFKETRDVKNDYWTWLPFANLNKTWKEKLSITLAYRMSIRRPGIGELNPTIDFSDPYNTRFGNENLEASTAHNFDLVLGRTKPKYFLNLGIGYNMLENLFSQLRTLLPDGKTQVTWENISSRKEYEISTWNGITLTRKLKVNASASYTHNQYSEFDRTVRKFRNGGSFTSNFNSNYIPTDKWNLTAGFNLNRFANPQGYARWNTSMNLGVQRRFFSKRLVVTINSIDPFSNQQRRIFTYGKNFNLESYSNTRTRNFRLSVAYNFTKTQKKKTDLKKAVQGVPKVKGV
ncbi:MAG TPA: outer membrane beta-barrel protein [Chitinophagaceae bacterium]|nr:outer membrane beta-barrel protein [Chitinophagaceae bacterium]